MEQNYDKEYWGNNKCPRVDCKKDACKCGLKKVFLASALGDDSEKSPIAPKNGAYCNAIVVYEANDHVYIYSTEGVPTLINVEGSSLEEVVEQLEKDLEKEVSDREQGDNTLQQEIDDLKNSPDVVDIVPTYAALQAYDTSSLGNNDIIRVLADETHDGQSTYYRWSTTTSTWTYIGAVGDYYTKGQVDTLLSSKQNTLTAGSNISISAQNVISATDTTYSVFTGTDGTAVGTAGLVPAPATTDAGKFLKADGSWDTVNAGPTVVQTTGTSTTDVMSQNAVTSMVYSDPGTNQQVQIGLNAKATGVNSVAIGGDSSANSGAIASSTNAVALGGYSKASAPYAIGIGCGSNATTTGQLDIGTTWTTSGYNNTNYRLLTGVHDPVNAHDAATKGYVDANAGGGIKTLTSADYNYHYGGSVDDGIALWLLNEGEYIIGDGNTQLKIYFTNTDFTSTNTIYGAIVLKKASGSDRGVYIFTNGNKSQTEIVTGIDTSGSNGKRDQLLVPVIDNLTNTSNNKALSANQGKVLKDLIDGLVIKNAGAPTTSTVGTVGQLLEDTTNGKLYICTAVDTTDPQNPSYTWTEVGAGGGSGPTVVQTTGSSQTDVMSQDAVTKMIYPDITGYPYKMLIGEGSVSAPAGVAINGNIASAGRGIAIGRMDGNAAIIGANGRAYRGVAVGGSASVGRGDDSIAIGESAYCNSGADTGNNVAIGANSYAGNGNCHDTVALGVNSKTTRTGEVNVGAGTSGNGYNSTNYRVIGGVHDGQDLHDAATVAQGNKLMTAAPTTSDAGVLGELWTDTTNMHTYQCTAISGSTYTWTQRW